MGKEFRLLYHYTNDRTTHTNNDETMQVLGLLSLCIGTCFAATTVQLLANDPKFSTLVNLVTQAGLVDDLNGGTFTIFAPNDAFDKISPDALASLATDMLALENVLKYHVVQGSVPSSAVTNELTLTTLDGEKARFNIYKHNNVITIQGSTVTTVDKMASNGVIHVIDTVMMPPEGDIVDIVAKTSDVSTLLSLVQKAGIADALKDDALTVFAPTNAAFNRLPSNLVNRITSDIGLLTEILEYHVVPHTEYSQGLFNREYLSTRDRHHDKIVIRASSAGVRVNNNGNVIKADIGAKNGVIHLIDHVLIPARYYLTLLVGK